jgi:hypothetical protein
VRLSVVRVLCVFRSGFCRAALLAEAAALCRQCLLQRYYLFLLGMFAESDAVSDLCGSIASFRLVHAAVLLELQCLQESHTYRLKTCVLVHSVIPTAVYTNHRKLKQLIGRVGRTLHTLCPSHGALKAHIK